MKENKMKPKRIQRHRGTDWQGKAINTGDRTTLSQAKPALGTSSSAQVKPFAGKVFYLDLPSNRAAEILESDIKELGGTVEKFFSKEIKYLVSNKREARYVRCFRQDSPVLGPDSAQSSPHPRSNPRRPGSHADNNPKKPQSQTDTFVTSRGKALVERVVKEQERVKMNKILSNALEWGVKILYVDDVIAYVQKRKKIVGSQCPATTAVKMSVKAESTAKQDLQKCKGGRIRKPFIKVEDSSRHYRPIYLTMPHMPEFSLRAVPPCSPFCAEDKDPPGNRQQGHRGGKAVASDERAHGRKKNRDKKRGGYCECCTIKYENLATHLQSERHKAFSKSEQYLVVDRQVSALRCNFIHIKTQVKRPKCSVSSFLVPPEPRRKAELRPKGDLDTTETVKEERHPTVGAETYSGHTLKIGSAAAPAHRTRREGDGRNCDTYADRSKHKCLARKRPCRQNSLSSCPQVAEQAQSAQPQLETAPSAGEGFVSFPSRVLRNDDASESLNVVANQKEGSDTNKDSLLFESAQEGSVSPDGMAGNEGERLPSQSFSPVRKIRRRVRVYKRKRRKLNAHAGHAEPSRVPPHSTLKLWELFLSSDDMDVEFRGFEA